MMVNVHRPHRPLENLEIREGLAGTEHEVRGTIAAIESPLKGSFGECPPTAEAELFLVVWYLLPDGDDWLFPRRRYSADNYYAGYDRLSVGTNKWLQQGSVIARTRIESGNAFVFKWRELITDGRTPYVEARHVTESTRDPNDPLGYKKITVKRVYRVEGGWPAQPPERPDGWGLFFTPNILLEFYGTETKKQLPPLSAACVPYLPG